MDALVEFFLFDQPEELSGRTATVFFHKRIREEKELHTPEELKAQLVIDQSQIDDLIF